MLRLFDTALGRVVAIEPRTPGEVSMYVCGPTVYDVPHIGHGRFTLVWDVIRRYLEWTGQRVRYVSNITDIEDKIIRRSGEEGRSTDEVVAVYEKAWYDAMDRLGVRRPDADPHATAYVDQMVAYIDDLVQRGRAYETGDGVYFSIDSLEGDYGVLARQSLDSLRSGARVEVNEEKRSPLDFALWKKAKPGEPTWPSPWGDGRPGWHIECTVMALDLLGEGFDLHGGGNDLAFPHHENERAQALGAQKEFARHWVHSGMVESGGQKMSKSLGNFTSLNDLLDRTDPRAYRLLVLRSHYRAPLEIRPDTLADATAALERLDAFARRVRGLDGEADGAAMERFRALMDDDLATPQVIALVFDLVREANARLDAGDATSAGPPAFAVAEILGALGVELRVDDEVDDQAAELVRRRDAARAARDWAGSDALRTELEGAGWAVEDTSDGTRVYRR